jgi:multiple sugar transport system permease protein
MAAPVVIAAVDSLFSRRASGLGFGGVKTEFVGLANYARALSDTAFLSSFGRVALFTVLQVPLMLAIALVIALVMASSRPALRKTLQVVSFSPYAVPTVIGALLWGFLYQPSVSPVIQSLARIGWHVDVLGQDMVLFAVANITTWTFTGVNALILFTALSAVPDELIDAARVDGAGPFRVAWSVKIPLIRPALALAAIGSAIGSAQLFNEPQVVSSLTRAIGANYTPVMSVYGTLTLGKDPNLAGAMALIVALVTFLLALTLNRFAALTRRDAVPTKRVTA